MPTVIGETPYGKEKFPHAKKFKSNVTTVIYGMIMQGRKASHTKEIYQDGVMRTKRFNCPKCL
jgi:hypothetical protein